MGGFLDSVSAPLTSILKTGGDLISAKYQADLAGHQADRAAEQNRALTLDTIKLNEDVASRAYERQKADNLALWEKDKAYQADLWTRQNEYNSPAAQMQRMKAAGLNPMLMYNMGTPGNATVIPAADPTTPRLEVPQATAPRRETVVPGRVNIGSDLVDGILSYFQIKNAGLQSANLEAQRDLIKNQADSVNQDVIGKKRENKLLDDTGTSKDDWDFIRFGGRAWKWFKSVMSDSDYVPSKALQYFPPKEIFKLQDSK